MEKEIRKTYKQAQKEISAKWDAFMAQEKMQKDIVGSLRSQYYLAKNAGFTEEARRIGEELGKAKAELKARTLYNEQFKRMTEDTAARLHNVNDIARNYVNDRLPSVYVWNYNELSSAVNGIGGISFTLVNEDTVRYMMTHDAKLIPHQTLSKRKDIAWNIKKINSSVLQGIIQGESMTEISKRLDPIIETNRQSTIHYARTMVTSAENKGLYDSYERAQEQGIVLQKEWSATGDNRVRPSHRKIDGERAELDEPFSNGLMYPADPNGSSDEAWNCRCRMDAVVVGFMRNGKVVKV